MRNALDEFIRHDYTLSWDNPWHAAVCYLMIAAFLSCIACLIVDGIRDPGAAAGPVLTWSWKCCRTESEATIAPCRP